jgi:hypothetical protein
VREEAGLREGREGRTGAKLSIRARCVSGSWIAETVPASTIAFLAVTEAAESGFSIVGVH